MYPIDHIAFVVLKKYESCVILHDSYSNNNKIS